MEHDGWTCAIWNVAAWLIGGCIGVIITVIIVKVFDKIWKFQPPAGAHWMRKE